MVQPRPLGEPAPRWAWIAITLGGGALAAMLPMALNHGAVTDVAAPAAGASFPSHWFDDPYTLPGGADRAKSVPALVGVRASDGGFAGASTSAPPNPFLTTAPQNPFFRGVLATVLATAADLDPGEGGTFLDVLLSGGTTPMGPTVTDGPSGTGGFPTTSPGTTSPGTTSPGTTSPGTTSPGTTAPEATTPPPGTTTPPEATTPPPEPTTPPEATTPPPEPTIPPEATTPPPEPTTPPEATTPPPEPTTPPEATTPPPEPTTAPETTVDPPPTP